MSINQKYTQFERKALLVVLDIELSTDVLEESNFIDF